MLNSIGVPNPGVRYWGEQILPDMIAAKVAVVASIWGTDADEVVGAASILSSYSGPIAWEINLSCPNSEKPGQAVSHDAKLSASVCTAVREMAPDGVSLWAKLSPDAEEILDVAAACVGAGADAVTVNNTYPGGQLELDLGHSLGEGYGGMSGAFLQTYTRPLLEKFAVESPSTPVVACGGVISSEVAVDYLSLGARAVQVGTASLYDPRACHKIARGVVSALTWKSAK